MSSVSQKRNIAPNRLSTDMRNIQKTVERLVEECLKKKNISASQKYGTSESNKKDQKDGTSESNKKDQKDGTSESNKKDRSIQTEEVIFKVSPVKANKNKNRSTGAAIIKKHFSDFWSNISLPGIKYVGENGQNSLDRYVWLMVLLVSIVVSCKYIHNSYTKWQSSPVLLSFNDTMTPISAVPFPAVTVCPGRQLSEKYISDVELAATECASREACSAEQWYLLSGGGLLCPKSRRLKKESEDKYLEGKIDKVIKGLSSSCAEDTTWFKLNGDEYSYNCSSRFQTLFLEGEVCFSFNMLPARDLFKDDVIPPMVDKAEVESKRNWTLDNMLQLADLLQTVPRHIDSNGRWAGLYFEMQKNTPIKQSLCGQSSTTAKVVFHHPGEIPLPETNKFYDLPPAGDLFIHLTPHLVTSSEELTDYTPEERRCYYANERNLSLFRTYTQRNCQLECRVNCSLSLCDCVPYYFPRHNDSVNICGRQHTEYCAELYLPAILGGRYTWREIVLMYREWVGDRIQEVFRDYKYDRKGSTFGGSRNVTEQLLRDTYPDCRCECPVACSSLGYDVEVNQQQLPDYVGLQVTRLAISFKELEFTSILRKELIGLTDFVADSGGVLGVFTGFTFLAVVELLYYVTLRLWKNIKHSWDGAESPAVEEVVSAPVLDN